MYVQQGGLLLILGELRKYTIMSSIQHPLTQKTSMSAYDSRPGLVTPCSIMHDCTSSFGLDR
jgi:hypothetical protein